MASPASAGLTVAFSPPRPRNVPRFTLSQAPFAAVQHEPGLRLPAGPATWPPCEN